MTKDPALPILDLALLDSTPENAAKFRSQLARATHEVGFFYLLHHLPSTLITKLHTTSRRFFSLPLESKLAIANVNSPQFRGYTALGLERTRGKVDLREQIDICPEGTALPPEELRKREEEDGEAFWRLVGPNQWPVDLPDLRDVVEEWQECCEGISRKLLRAWANIAQNEAEKYGREDQTGSGVREEATGQGGQECHQAASENGEGENGPKDNGHHQAANDTSEVQGVGAHKDAGVLTLLWIDGSDGLQVERDSTWIDVPPLPGAFVVNIGEMLEYATQGYLKATSHRVTLNKGTGDRISVPYFFNPALDARLPLIRTRAKGGDVKEDEEEKEGQGGDGDGDGEREERDHGHTILDDPDNPIFALYGENCLKSRLRSHPDVAQRWHSDLIRPVAT